MNQVMAMREAAWIARCLGRGDTAPLSAPDVEQLAQRLGVCSLGAGERLFGQGTTPEAVWVVRAGEVELSVRAGARRHAVKVLYAGDVTGDIELLLGMEHAFTARAVEPSVVLRLDRQHFETLLSVQPRVARRWLFSLAARLAGSQRRILHLLEGDLHRQVVRLLLDEANADEVRLPQETIAALLGARRPSVNKVLKDLEADGLVEIAYRRVRLVDRTRLERSVA